MTGSLHSLLLLLGLTLPSVHMDEEISIRPSNFPLTTEEPEITVTQSTETTMAGIMEPVRTETSSEDLCYDENVIEKKIITTVMTAYDKQSLPSGGQNAITALVEMHINDIPSLSELNSEFELDLMFSEMWTDRRLEYANLPEGQCISNITLGNLYGSKFV